MDVKAGHQHVSFLEIVQHLVINTCLWVMMCCVGGKAEGQHRQVHSVVDMFIFKFNLLPVF